MNLGDVEIHWLGHASFMLKCCGKTVYLDPYVIPENPEKADIILVTHEHFDHCAPEKIERIKKEDTVIITTEGASKKCSGNVRVIHPDESMDVKGVRIHAVWAYNIGKQFHPKGLGVGFVVELGGKRIYHAGDTDVIPEMKDLEHFHIDLALLPVGGTYTMNLDEALEALKLIKPKAVVPMHYNYLEGLELSREQLEDFKKKAESLGVQCYILEPEVK